MLITFLSEVRIYSDMEWESLLSSGNWHKYDLSCQNKPAL